MFLNFSSVTMSIMMMIGFIHASMTQNNCTNNVSIGEKKMMASCMQLSNFENRNSCMMGCGIAAKCAIEKCERVTSLRKRSLDEYLGALESVAYNVKSSLMRRDNEGISVMDPETGKTIDINTGYLTKLGRRANEKTCSMSNHGQQTCSPDNQGFLTCVYDKWIAQLCGRGTTCHAHPSSSNHILCH